MSSTPIYNDSLLYELLRSIVQFVYPKFFRTFEIGGFTDIPEGVPVILAANHQSGLMDPLAVILAQEKPVVYMARADIFQNKLAAILLEKIKVTPIYRIRDGYENLSRNDQQLSLANDVLLNRKRLGIMPEGNHGFQHKLRPLVKGLFRVAFSAQLELEGLEDVLIIPIGIDHSKFQHAGGDLILNVGAPIKVSDFIQEYKDNQAVGINTLKQELADKMSEVMHDIRSDRYEESYALCCYGTASYVNYNSQSSKFKTVAGKRFEGRVGMSKFLHKLEHEDSKTFNQLALQIKRLEQLPASTNERAEFLEEKQSLAKDVASLLATVFSIPGMLLNTPSWALNRILMASVEDKHMYNSFAFGVGLFTNLVWYPVVTVILSLLFGLTLLKGLTLFLLLVTIGIASEKTRQALRMYWKMLPYRFGSKKRLLDAARKDFENVNRELSKLLQKK